MNFVRSNLNIKYFIKRIQNSFGNLFNFRKTVYLNRDTERPLSFDFYIPKSHILIEYDGRQHFYPYFQGQLKNPNNILLLQKESDQIKTVYANTKNIPLIRINYTQIKNIEEILTTKLL